MKNTWYILISLIEFVLGLPIILLGILYDWAKMNFETGVRLHLIYGSALNTKQMEDVGSLINKLEKIKPIPTPTKDK